MKLIELVCLNEDLVLCRRWPRFWSRCGRAHARYEWVTAWWRH